MVKEKAAFAEVSEKVRLSETDPYGIAHHSSYAVWVEIGLQVFFEEHAPEKKAEIVGFDCKYLRSAKAGDKILIRVAPERSGTGSDFRFWIVRGQTILAQGSITTDEVLTE